MADYKTVNLSVDNHGFFGIVSVNVCTTCGALVGDTEIHDLDHRWSTMTVSEKINYARKKVADGGA